MVLSCWLVSTLLPVLPSACFKYLQVLASPVLLGGQAGRAPRPLDRKMAEKACLQLPLSLAGALSNMS